MSNECMSLPPLKHEKIKTHFAKIVVGGTVEKPCFSIWYFDPADKDYHIGFSSFCLDYVFEWFGEEFEIIPACAGCVWAKGKRPQKCSCCKRNPIMKDCYERAGESNE